MIDHDPRSEGNVVHGLAKPKPKRAHRSTAFIEGALFTCNIKGSPCNEHTSHSEIGMVVKAGLQTLSYLMQWSYEDPRRVRQDSAK